MEILAAAAILLIIEFGIVEDKREEFVAISTERVDEIRSFDGNQSFDVLLDDARPGVVIYVEKWDSADQQAAFYEWWIAEGMTERLRPLVTSPPSVSTYRVAED